MNFIQFGLFGVFFLSSCVAGIVFYHYIDDKKIFFRNRYLFLGETLLLGSIVHVGIMLLLSLVHLYSAPFLWTGILLPFLFLTNEKVRDTFKELILSKPKVDLPLILFVLLLAIFVFRNCFFIMDIDSHSGYLLAQKIWLEQGTSLYGNLGTDKYIFAPQFNAIPYALGLSIYPQETLFPQLINLFWRLIVLLLVFGYTSYRFNRYYGLAAATIILLNHHFFYSGINGYVIINAAVIALLFAGVYNFWEAKKENKNIYFVLALIFMSQIILNKYQMAIIMGLVFVLGIFIQPKWWLKLRSVVQTKRYFISILGVIMIALMWFLKNYIVTGSPTFPLLAGRFGALGWTPEMDKVFVNVSGMLPLSLVLKYISYLFIWPGVKVLKIVIVTIIFLPLILFFAHLRSSTDKESVNEFCYWLGVCMLSMIGLCLIGFFDPRNYRYLIAIAGFSAIFSMDFILSNCLLIKNRFITGAMILIISSLGYHVMFVEIGGGFRRPTFKQNIQVILNQIHTDDVIDDFYPEHRSAINGFNQYKEKAMRSAWEVPFARKYSAFMLPTRPQLVFRGTNIIKWDSYDKEELIVEDLKDYGIEYVMKPTKDELLFLTPEEYAPIAMEKGKQRFPKEILYDYGFPKELTQIR